MDALPTGDDRANLVREVTCTEGVVTVEHDLRIRPDYNRSSPWVHLRELPEGGSGIAAIAGPDMLVLRGPLAGQELARSILEHQEWGRLMLTRAVLDVPGGPIELQG